MVSPGGVIVSVKFSLTMVIAGGGLEIIAYVIEPFTTTLELARPLSGPKRVL